MQSHKTKNVGKDQPPAGGCLRPGGPMTQHQKAGRFRNVLMMHETGLCRRSEVRPSYALHNWPDAVTAADCLGRHARRTACIAGGASSGDSWGSAITRPDKLRLAS